MTPILTPAGALDSAPRGHDGGTVRAYTPWGRTYLVVRRAGPDGLPEAALPAEHAPAVPELIAAGILARVVRDGVPVLTLATAADLLGC